MPEIIKILDSSINVYKNNLKELLIVVEYNGFKAGLIVDTVLSIEAIPTIFGQGNINNEYYNTKLISSVGKTEKTQATVLMLDIEAVLSKIEEIDIQKIELPKEVEVKKEVEEIEDVNQTTEEMDVVNETEFLEQLEISEILEPHNESQLKEEKAE